MGKLFLCHLFTLTNNFSLFPLVTLVGELYYYNNETTPCNEFYLSLSLTRRKLSKVDAVYFE